MISVGSRDARKGMSLGFDSGGGVGDMEETELEEGEAFSYHNNDGYDESIDPDVALSYIDEKLQDVLGHFQKDFEGGVSAENLGAKFGGYGSFLPTYQRSPVWSHPRTPGKVQNFNSPISPNNSQLENGFRHSAVSSSQSVSLAPASTSATSLPALKQPSLNEKPAPRNNESANKKTSKSSDRKTLKVRIKVGSGNLSTRKNAEIYSGLGLDVSPSSSLDESPSGSDESPNESPTNILQIMTSFAIPGNLLLSPLPDDLLRLTEKTMCMKDSRFPVMGEKKSTGLKKKEMVNEALGCEELVSNTLKLPLLSNEPDLVVEKPKVGEDKKESSFDKMKKALYAELMDPPKQKVNQKPDTNELNGVKLHAEKRKSKENSRLGSSIPKSKKNTHANGSTTKSELEELKVRKEILKTRDAYKDFFGEMNLDEQERQIDALKLPSEGRLKDSGVIEKTDRLSMSEAYPKAVSNIVPQPTNGPGPGPNPDGLSIKDIKDNWVCCDKCQHWRLLPLGTNPEDLPDKWTCSMLNWLPKMNRCSVTEEETTTALLALYQVPTAENQNYLHNAGAALSGAPPSGFWNQSHQNYGLQKKKQGLNEPANAPIADLPKKNLPPLINKSDSLQLSKSGDLPVEKHRHKHKEKQKVTENYSDGGDTRHLKMKSKKDDADQDCFRTSKKVKTESDEDWRLDHGGSSSGFDAKKDQLKYSDRGSSKERYDTKDMSQVLVKKTKEEAFGSLDFGNCDNNRMMTPKKRKVKEGQDPAEEFSENDYRTEKKARVSKGRSQQSLDGTDYVKREVATSSSSKISGSHKTKTSLQEVKGSPVESVSSSPMRVLDLASSRRELKEKDETRGAEFLKCSNVDEKDKTFSVTHRSMDSMLDLHDKNCNNLSGSKAKTKVVLSSDNITNHHFGNESQPRKSGKGSSRSKDKSRREKQEDVSKSKSKVSASVNETQDTKVREGKSKFQEKPGGKYDESEKKHVSKKDSSRKSSGTEKKLDDSLSTPKLNPLNHDGERSSKRSEKNDQKDSASGKGRPLPLPPSGSGQSRPVSVTYKGNESDKLAIDGFEVDDALKAQKPIKKADNQQVNLRLATPSGHRVRDHEAPSPLRRDSSSHAASSALKEAKDLKHRADRIKNTESDMERTDLYFEAVLKFLRASSLLESSNSENGKHGEMIQAMQIYSSTAKLCDFCAHEYEKQKNIAFAALAYKCTEVAYMRVIYSSHSGASRDRHELQTALQMVPPGESPSSSASDVDNLNNLAAADKVIIPKSVGSPQVAGNHVIAAKTRPNFSRLLNFTQDVHLAMEASRKSRVSFAAANATFSDAKYKEGIASIRRALDFNFQDVEGLLRLVRLAMEAFNP